MTAATDRTAHSWPHQKRRAYFAPLVEAGLINCWRCGQPITGEWELGHRTDRALGGDDIDTYPEHKWPTGDCPGNRHAGGWRTANAKRSRDQRGDDGNPTFFSDAATTAGSAMGSLSLPEQDHPDLPEFGPDPADSVWDRCDWLESLRDVPDNARWPRLMTGPHPAAVGSLGAEAIGWLREEVGLRLRWFQELGLVRALEHDRDGRLVWLEYLLSTARQVGKSVELRGGATWRMHQADRFDEPQLVLHTARDLGIARDVQTSTRVWGRRRGYFVREVNGAQEVATPPDEQGERSRWLVRAVRAVYGYPSTLGIVDEAWGIPADVVDDGIEPTQSEREQPQMWLLSTAHRRATSLFPGRRAAARGSLTSPGSSLLIEWSATPDAAIEDRTAWRMASPHWSPGRERLLEAKLKRVLSGASVDPDEPDPVESFKAQYLNIWPVKAAAPAGAVTPLVDGQVWAAAGDLRAAVPAGPLVLAVDDWGGTGAAAALAARLGDGRVLVCGQLFESRARAAAWVLWQASTHAGSRLLVGAQLVRDAAVVALGEVEKMGAGHTSAGLPKIRELLAAGRLVHDGGRGLTGQVGAARVATSRAGGLLLSPRSGRSDLVRCAAWAVAAAAELPAPAPARFVIR
jgi:hypothetical protein